MNIRPIGVFDSGVGGLSVLRELHKILPNEDYIFLADQAYIPYGGKTKQQLIERSCRIADYFVSQSVKMIVVACNTATCYALDALRKKYNLPFIGTVPAIESACEQTQSKVIGVVSTPATSRSKTVKNFIIACGPKIKIINIGCSGLEDAVENGNLKSPAIKKLLNTYLLPIKKSKADCLVLGCTHYPFLKNNIIKIFDRPIALIDSGPAIAQRAKKLLSHGKIMNKHSRKGRTVYFTTGDGKKFSVAASSLLKHSVKGYKVKI